MNITQIYEELQGDFIEHCTKAEEGTEDAIVIAVKFKEEMDYLNALAEDRKAWLNENADAVVNQAEQYGKDGFRGYIFSQQTKKTYSFNSIPEWNDVKLKLKDIEEKAKLALRWKEKGVEPVDMETGQIMPTPEVKLSSFIKVEKVK